MNERTSDQQRMRFQGAWPGPGKHTFCDDGRTGLWLTLGATSYFSCGLGPVLVSGELEYWCSVFVASVEYEYECKSCA